MMIIKNQLKKLSTVFWSLKQIIFAAPKETLFLFIQLVSQGIIPTLSLFIMQNLVNWVSNSIPSSAFPFALVSIWSIILLVETLAEPLLALNRLRLNEKVLAHCNLLLMTKANRFEGLEFFENKASYNDIQFLKEEAKRRPLNFVYIITGVLRSALAVSGVLFMLASLNWWIPFFVFLSAIPHAISTVWFEKQSWDLALFRSPESRKMAWLSGITLDEKFAKEIRLFGFGDFLVNYYKSLAHSFQKAMRIKRAKESFKFLVLSTLTVLGHLYSFIRLIHHAKTVNLTSGAVVMGLQAFVLAQREISYFMQNLGMLTQTLLFFEKFKTFLETHIFSQKHPKTPFNGLKTGIIFENVSFQYPDGREALTNVSLQIAPKEKIALVGENGAGKSTLVKLILGFYYPTSGRILIDGIDLKDLDLSTWRKEISTIFQDFGQYHLTIAENIGLGNVDLISNEEAIKQAALHGGFSAVAEALPQQYQTSLGKEFDGTSLSGGQWQKLAMSRAFLKRASILILDEPTASLDPKSEYEVFQKFSDVSRDKTTILITHRLGSVSMADRILVLKEGRLVEDGSHEDLCIAGKDYASLYAMQAKQYQFI